MRFIKNIEEIDGIQLFNLSRFKDSRGYFQEIYNNQNKLDYKWIQENQSCSYKNVFRGMHFQKEKFSQTKLLRVIRGTAFDITIDLRKKSKTYLNTFQITLEDKDVLLIPKGIAHGILCLKDETIISYKVDQEYSKENDSGINPFKSNLEFDWPIKKSKIIVSEKDKLLSGLDNSKEYF